MPYKHFGCSCGHVTVALLGILDDSFPPCDECGEPTINRDYASEAGEGRTTKVFDKPIEMYSVGMTPNEIPAFERKLPLIEHREGVPLARTRHEKKQILRYFGFQEN
jgi:hypothetical protein